MSFTGFKPSVKLVLEAGASARIIDSSSKRMLVLTPTEGRVLSLLMPGTTEESLATSARGAGFEVEPKQIQALLMRLKANGFLDYSPAATLKADPAFSATFKSIQIASIKRAQEGSFDIVQFTVTCSFTPPPA